MPTMTEQLLPCPFCGGTNIDPAEWSGNDGKHGPGCADCGALADSASSWNRRTTQPEQVAATTILIDASTATSLIEAGALRQFRHNDGSDGFVFGYDKAITDRVFASIAAPEPVARLLHWNAPKHMPAPHDGICARTFAEFPKGAGEGQSGGYWREGQPLYTAAPAQVALDDVRKAYHELTYSVRNKFPGETRHQTALRYIREREKSRTTTGCAVNPSDGQKGSSE